MLGKEVGPYRILQKVAQGGMCAVYKGLHTGLEQEVAIKILSPESFEDPCIRERFFNEAKIQAKLSHPNVIKTLNYVEQDGSVFLIMEYVNGETLDVLLKRLGALPIPRATAIFASVLEAIDFMHSKGIIHRDIKPSNIMLSYDRFVKVMDFGIAKVMGETGKTKAGIRIGTLWYMSPEQIRGQEATVLSDIYSLGVTFYQMVTGVVPFTGDMEFDIMKAHLEETPVPPWKVNKEVPKELGEIILKAIAKNPKDRYQNIRELLEALRGVTKSFGETKVITVLPGTDDGWKEGAQGATPPRHRALVIAGAFCLVASVAMAAFFLMPDNAEKSQPPDSASQNLPQRPEPVAALTEPSPPPAQPPAEEETSIVNIVKQQVKKTASAEKRPQKKGGDAARQSSEQIAPPEPEPAPEAAPVINETKWKIRK